MSEKFGVYTLVEVLGEGDMGTTYRAQLPNQEEFVALKILDKLDTSSDMKRGAAVEMIEFAATLKHDRLQPVLAVLDSPDGNGRLGIVTRLSSVGSFGSLMAKGKNIAPKYALKMIGQIASGLQFLHDQEVAHGSLKPNNILLDTEGNITLTDLSMAHLRELGLIPREITEQHMLFMQPEREFHATPQIPGDIYSLAVLTYLLLNGSMPFHEPEPEARGVIPPGNLSIPLAAVLRRAMNPHLRLRYTTLNEYMLALKNATQGNVDDETMKVFGGTGMLTLPPDSAE
ncbi:MAG TPA: protein kinase [Aggregatilineales bacterium]|nr:protein kinase [Aggregatilineales bacterium]